MAWAYKTERMDWLFLLVMFVFFTIMILVTRFCRRLRQRHYDVTVTNYKKGHRWCMADVFAQSTYCNVSERRIVEGAYCDSCGVRVDDDYMQDANKMLPCKELASDLVDMRHHWIKGNLSPGSQCRVCNETCGDLPQLCDFRCCWCLVVVHERCVKAVDAFCDLGPFGDCIVPPNCLQLKLVGVAGRRRFVVESVVAPSFLTWKPVIVMANRKSGNGDAGHLLQGFRRLLNPLQVVDLCETSPECALEWCRLLPNATWRVIVAGGDGTVGWVISAIDSLKLKVCPEFFIIPLGTGNDLSRVLGCGEGYSGEIEVYELLVKMKKATVVKLDRWQLEIIPRKHFGIRMPMKHMIVNNYASIGVDALVALNFHRHRESQPMLFGSRFINKFWYFTYGTKDVLERECKDLQLKIKLEMDDKEVDLPSIEGIVILNISSWGGGCFPWQTRGSSGKIPESRFDDGLLEVFALYSSFHIAQLQVGLVEPLRLGQAKVIKITLLKGNAPMQVDGEPWLQHPATMTIRHHNQMNMLSMVEEP